MKRWLRFVCAATVLFPLLGGVARSDGNTGTVRGFVRAPDGRPICGLLVTARSNREGEWTARTSADGSYLFLALFPGDVQITFESRDPIAQSTWVSPNLNSIVDMTIPANEYRGQTRCPPYSRSVAKSSF
jgi:Carboxypeptidase regulatory-like domain